MIRSLCITLALCLAFVPARARAEQDEGELAAEIALPDQGHHWLAEKPVGTSVGPVSQEMLDRGASDPSRWLLYGGNYRNFRHSPIAALTPASAAKLEVAWAFPSGTTGQFEVSPVVYGGVMYVTSSYNRIFALDAKTGALLWRYDHPNPKNLRLCCGPPNRGAAIAGDLVLMATLDAHLLAFDRKTGEIKWSVELASYKEGFSATSAPLVVGDLAIIGIAGGEYGVRGFFDAYDVKTGARAWRHYTIPGEGEPGVETWAGDSWKRGGAPAWTQGAYDAESDTLFWATGNPSPDWNGDDRAGDNLYSDSLLAVDPKTGKLKWYFQFTPHDLWDYDGNTQLFLVDTVVAGKPVKAIAQANRNGYFYLLDRTTGKFLRATKYLEQVNWATIDPVTGRPNVDPKALPGEDTTERICPSNLGGMNGAWTGAYNPELGLAFIPAVEACQIFAKGIAVYSKGMPYLGGLPDTLDANEGKSYGTFSAIDVATGAVRWVYKDRFPLGGGTLSTAGGVVFTGNLTGDALAFDSKTGKEVWRFRMGGGVRSQPIAYQLDGRTYVAIASGSFSALDAFMGGPKNTTEGGTLFVFALPK
ncbi:MAG: PQQ-dependent dehydrogenase, methanol/ethanol family [Deltaproteobacteria bacterium]|nr:PQQ-dependent dehydrogenase, methanol/ethanol family [Deltaproteobacteria bacterium]